MPQAPVPRRRLLKAGLAALLLALLALAAAAVWYTDEPTRPSNAAPVISATTESPARFVDGSEPLADNGAVQRLVGPLRAE